jgi:L-ascorbate metabolism protein UlaG (beta-lactamase superfamily)
VRIRWLGHSSFLITSDAGTKVLTDPYTPGRGLNYGPITEMPDVISVSHGHSDHNNISGVPGKATILDKPGKTEIRGIKIQAFASYHDETGGSQRGSNIVFCFDLDGVRICHLGDLGHVLGDKDVAEIGPVDVLLVPVGGFFTIDAKTAAEVSQRLSPKVIVPMHYKNDKCLMPIAGVEEFLRDKTSVVRSESSDAQFVLGRLPETPQILVLRPAM